MGHGDLASRSLDRQIAPRRHCLPHGASAPAAFSPLLRPPRPLPVAMIRFMRGVAGLRHVCADQTAKDVEGFPGGVAFGLQPLNRIQDLLDQTESDLVTGSQPTAHISRLQLATDLPACWATPTIAGAGWDQAEVRSAAAGTTGLVIDRRMRRSSSMTNPAKSCTRDDADEPRHPASLTKIMTLYLLFEQLRRRTVKLDTPLLDLRPRPRSRTPRNWGSGPIRPSRSMRRDHGAW